MDFDLLVIGEERGGIDRAIEVAQGGWSVGVIATGPSFPSLDDLRLAVINVTERNELTMAAWRAEVSRLVGCQSVADDVELQYLGVERIAGDVQFISPTSVQVTDRGQTKVYSSEEILVACGSRSRQPATFQCDDHFVTTVESLLELRQVPQTMIVVGAGETGLSAAIMLAEIGVEVTVVDEHVTLLELCGLFDSRFDAIQELNIAFRLDDEVIGTDLQSDLQAAVRLASGRILTADAVLACVGREGCTSRLNLEAVGVGLDERGRVWCDDAGRTWASQISAVGDVVGFTRKPGRRTSDVHPVAIHSAHGLRPAISGAPAAVNYEFV